METNTPHFPENMNGPPKRSDKPGHDSQVYGASGYASQSTGPKRAFTQPTHTRVHAQQQRQQPAPNRTSTQVASRQTLEVPRSAVIDVLPYCTTEPPLTQEQVIALSDVAGSMKELVLLALSAATGDRAIMERIVTAVGQSTANNIIDFFISEWEVEG